MLTHEKQACHDFKLHDQKHHGLNCNCKLSILVARCNLQQTFQYYQIEKSGSLQLIYNLLKQLAAGLWITSLDNQPWCNQLATSVFTTCKMSTNLLALQLVLLAI